MRFSAPVPWLKFEVRVFGGIALVGAVALFAWPWFRRLIPELPVPTNTFLLAVTCLAIGIVLFFIASRTE